MPRNDEIRITSDQIDRGGRPALQTRLTPAADVRQCAILAQPTAVIPVVFLPGIMGTNLMSDTGSKVWRPPNTDGVVPVLGAIGQMFAYIFRGPATRQRMLDPETVQVDGRGAIDTEGSLDKQAARDRGWGALMRSAYHPVMSQMQRRLNNIMESCELLEWWNAEAQRVPADYGDEKVNPALDVDDLKHAATFRYEVWGGGYNWLQSNEDSGQDLIDYIEDVVLAHHHSLGEAAEKVILVTHSMGGLVGRSIARLHDYGKLLGVVHGVMPATGAPATYHHCRCGYEGVSQLILGRNAKEVTAIVANAPGALELLPSTDYGEGRAWLKLGGPADRPSHALPLADPYTEIYQSRKWYGLVPEVNAEMLDPAGLNGIEGVEGIGVDPFDRFDLTVDDVKWFHSSISGNYPEPAYVHYGADTRMHGWTDVHWQGAEVVDPARVRLEDDDGNGKLRVTDGSADFRLRFGSATQPGDGTVPTVSGAAPGLVAVQACFRQGDEGEGEHVKLNGKGKDKGYEHQDSYNDVRSQWATLYSVVRLSRGADWA